MTHATPRHPLILRLIQLKRRFITFLTVERDRDEPDEHELCLGIGARIRLPE